MLLRLTLQHPEHAYCIGNVASNNGGSWQHQENGEQVISVSVCGPHKLSRGLALNVCVVRYIRLFQCCTSSTV